MAAVALILNGNKFLLIKRADQEGDPWSGHMALPGGHRENGETCEQAAIRETMEETGLSVTVKRLLGLYHTLNGHVSVAAYECISSNTEVHHIRIIGETSCIMNSDEELQYIHGAAELQVA